MKRVMPADEFKATCKPGDLLRGFGTGKVVQITAIGQKRFLYVDGRGLEGVSLIENNQARWQKIETPAAVES